MARLFSDLACVAIVERASGRLFCGPSELNGATLCSDSVEPGPRVRSSKTSNVDLTGKKVVKRGVLVSWGGLRFRVLRIEGGRAYYGDAFSNSVSCGLVQVVS